MNARGLNVRVLLAAVALSLGVAGSAGALAQPSGELPAVLSAPAGRYVEGEILVTIKRLPDVLPQGLSPNDVRSQPAGTLAAVVDRSIDALGGTVTRTIPLRRGSQVQVVKLPPGRSVQQAIQDARKQLQVQGLGPALDQRVFVEPNYLWFPLQLPATDPYMEYLWGLHNYEQAFMAPLGIALRGREDADIDAAEAWGVHDDASGIVVAVIDTGVMIDHPDLQGAIWTNTGETPGNGVDDDGNGYIDDVHGWDFFHGDDSVFDEADGDDHGTHVAGTIAAMVNNDEGIAGIAWGAKIMPLKFLGPNGGSTDDAIEAVNYAVEEGAMLSNNSWGGGGYSEALRTAIEESGMLFVAAAGNEAVDNDVMPHYPSSYDLDNVIAVAASDWTDGLASFSNYGANSVDLAAPGVFILSSVPGPGYDYFSGTSMATPHVTGSAALVIAANPGMIHYPGAPGWSAGQETIKDRILQSTDQIGTFAGKTQTAGRLNLYNALMGIYPPQVSAFTADRVYGEGDLTVTFTWDVALRDLSAGSVVRLDFGDGSPVQEVDLAGTAQHTYSAPGFHTASIHAATAAGGDSYREIGILVNDPTNVLLIDDDAQREWSDTIEAALQAAAIPYIAVPAEYVWAGSLPPTVSNVLLWTAGITVDPSLMPDEIGFLQAYLDNGGRLFLTGRGILNDLRGSAFARDYLHVDTVVTDFSTTSITGVSQDPVGGGLSFAGSFPWVDYYNVADGAAGVLMGDGTTPPFVAHRYAGDYRLIFAAFDVHRLAVDVAGTDGDLAGLLTRAMAYLGAGQANQAPVVTYTVSDQLNKGTFPMTVRFQASVSDPDSDAVSSTWRFWRLNESDQWVLDEEVAGLSATRTYTDGLEHLVSFVADDGDGNRVERFIDVITAEKSPGARDVVLFIDDPDEDSKLVLGPDNWAAEELAYAGFDVVLAPSAVLPYLSGQGDVAASGTERFWVLWDGRIWGYPDETEQPWIASLLDRGGRVWLSGEDLLGMIAGGNFQDGPPVPFIQQYFHIGHVQHDTGQATTDNWLRGVPVDDVGRAHNLWLLWGDLGAEDLDYTDTIQPAATGQGVLYDEGRAVDPNYSTIRYSGAYYSAFGAFTPQMALGYSWPAEEAAKRDAMTQRLAAARATARPEPRPTVRLNPRGLPAGPLVKLLAARPAGAEIGPEVDVEPTAPTALADFWADLYEAQNKAPVARAVGTHGVVGAPVIVSGAPSSDPDPGDRITAYHWKLLDQPAGSNVALDVTSSDPTVAVTPDRPGSYRIELTVTDSFGATSQPVTAEIVIGAAFAAPNPADDEVTFYYEGTFGGGTLRVFNVAGRLVKSLALTASGAVTWDLTDVTGRPVASGLYLWILLDKEGKPALAKPERLVVQR